MTLVCRITGELSELILGIAIAINDNQNRPIIYLYIDFF